MFVLLSTTSLTDTSWNDKVWTVCKFPLEEGLFWKVQHDWGMIQVTMKAPQVQTSPDRDEE